MTLTLEQLNAATPAEFTALLDGTYEHSPWVAEAAWADEAHVDVSRAMYQDKFRLADDIFRSMQAYQRPEGGFFLWLPVGDGETATLKLWRETGVRVLPGAYLSRDVAGQNPGKEFIRVALVAPKDETEAGLTQLRDCLYA